MGWPASSNKQQDSVTEKYDDKCVLGTADYLAPNSGEQFRGQSGRTFTVWAAPSTSCSRGRRHSPTARFAAKLVAHQTRAPKGVESYRSDVPPEILEICGA